MCDLDIDKYLDIMMTNNKRIEIIYILAEIKHQIKFKSLS